MEISSARFALRNAMETVMNMDKLYDSDIEKVESGIHYSRGIRTLCVLDPRFEEQIDVIEKLFEEEYGNNALLLCETYSTLYGNVVIRKITSDKIVIALSDIFQESGKMKEGR